MLLQYTLQIREQLVQVDGVDLLFLAVRELQSISLTPCSMHHAFLKLSKLIHLTWHTMRLNLE